MHTARPHPARLSRQLQVAAEADVLKLSGWAFEDAQYVQRLLHLWAWPSISPLAGLSGALRQLGWLGLMHWRVVAVPPPVPRYHPPSAEQWLPWPTPARKTLPWQVVSAQFTLLAPPLR